MSAVIAGRNVQRVLIIGSGGSGKTTVAKEVAVRTGLPLIHLDRLFWHTGWANALTRTGTAPFRD